MAILIGLFSASCFGLNMVIIRKGMHTRPNDDGHFMSALVNVIVLAAVLPIIGTGSWNLGGVLAFMAAGSLTTFAGRGLSMHAVRLIGPTRQSVFLMGAPLVAAVGGVAFLSETITALQATGGVLIMGGLLLATKGRTAESVMTVETPTSDLDEKTRRRGYIFSVIAMLCFGIGFVVSKAGTNLLPSAIAGAFVASSTALVLITAKAILGRKHVRLFEDNVRRLPVWFIVGGSLTAVGLLARFVAFIALPGWVVAVLMGTQAIWTAVWSYAFLRDEEVFTKESIASLVIVTVGVILLAQHSGSS